MVEEKKQHTFKANHLIKQSSCISTETSPIWLSFRQVFLKQHKEIRPSTIHTEPSIVRLWTTMRELSPSPRRHSFLIATKPHFVVRTHRRLAQRFNFKMVQAVNKELAHTSRASIASSTTTVCSSIDEEHLREPQTELSLSVPLSLRDRLRLKFGRRWSRNVVPVWTEGNFLECRVRELVYGQLRNNQSFEGQICERFFEKMDKFQVLTPVTCRNYMNQVRDTIRDLSHFFNTFRVPEWNIIELSNSGLNEENSVEVDVQIERAVQHTIEEYFCLSIRSQLHKWTNFATESTNRNAFRRTLHKWSQLSVSSPMFGLDFTNHDELEKHPNIVKAIEALRVVGDTVTPTRKMEQLLEACYAISAYIGESELLALSASDNNLERDSLACTGSADAFLPLLIFAVARSNTRDPFHNCSLLNAMYPFEQQHGERMYYLTMFEAALVFIRNNK